MRFVAVATALAALCIATPALAADLDAQLIQKTEASVSDTMKDPASVQYSEVRVVHARASNPDPSATGTFPELMRIPTRVCGRLNAKNAYGGYAGRTPFVAGWREDGTPVILVVPPDENPTALALFVKGIEQLCGD